MAGRLPTVEELNTGAPVLRDALREIRAVGEPVGALRATTFDGAVREFTRLRSSRAWFYGSFASAAIIVLTVGILGLVAMSTAARTREIGIRSALGATRDRLTRTLVSEQLTAVLTGLAAGLLFAWWASGVVRLYLYGFTKTDWRVWIIAAGIVLMASVVGAFIPPLRATRVDPVQALRVE